MDLELILHVASECLALKPHGFNGDPNGYDKAIVGITDNGQLVYSKEKMAKILSEVEDSMTEDDCWDFLEFNTFSAYVGEQTPIYINTYE